jgi:hypothetical protein
VICTDTIANQSADSGHCIGMEIWAEDVVVSNFTCENAYRGLSVRIANPAAHTIDNNALSNIRILRAKGVDGMRTGIYWDGSLGSGFSQLGPFHITGLS